LVGTPHSEELIFRERDETKRQEFLKPVGKKVLPPDERRGKRSVALQKGACHKKKKKAEGGQETVSTAMGGGGKRTGKKEKKTGGGKNAALRKRTSAGRPPPLRNFVEGGIWGSQQSMKMVQAEK